jgi:hypothetical protein
MGEYLKATSRTDMAGLCEQHKDLLVADEGAQYDQVIEINLDTLEPHINGYPLFYSFVFHMDWMIARDTMQSRLQFFCPTLTARSPLDPSRPIWRRLCRSLRRR